MTQQVQVSFRIIYGKFSYFLTEWYDIAYPNGIETIRRLVEKQWQIIKHDPNLRVDHLRIVQEKSPK